MEITKANFEEEFENITKNLKRSSFVGFDAEFTAILSGEGFKHRYLLLLLTYEPKVTTILIAKRINFLLILGYSTLQKSAMMALNQMRAT